MPASVETVNSSAAEVVIGADFVGLWSLIAGLAEKREFRSTPTYLLSSPVSALQALTESDAFGQIESRLLQLKLFAELVADSKPAIAAETSRPRRSWQDAPVLSLSP